MNQELADIRKKIEGLPLSLTKGALIEEGIALADSLNDLDQGYKLRIELVKTANFTGQPEKSLVAFGWLLSISDQYPDKFPESNILWYYKWMISNLLDFPAITRQQIEETMADLEMRFIRNGPSKRPILKLQCGIASQFGEEEKIRKLLNLWNNAPRVGLSDCLACECHFKAYMNGELKKYKTAIIVAQPIFTGKLRCHSIPHRTYAYFLEILVRLGDRREAMRFHERGYPLVKDDPGFIQEISQHIQFLVLMKDLKKATLIFKRHLRLALENRVPDKQFHFFRVSLFLLRQIAKENPKNKKFTISGITPPWQDETKGKLSEIILWLENEARRIADDFDARNQNSQCNRNLNDLVELEGLIQPLDS